MSDDSLPLCQTIIQGLGGSGKTTFALKYLRRSPSVCRFIFDDFGSAARLTGIRPACTATELEAALQSRWVIFNPHRMFEGQPVENAFRFFCRWSYDASKRGPGRKQFLCDEIWRFTTPASIPMELCLIAQTGRIEGIEVVSATHRINQMNETLLGQCTELVCFRTDGPNALKKIDDLSDGKLPPDKIRNLPLFKFISLNRLSGVTLSGKT